MKKLNQKPDPDEVKEKIGELVSGKMNVKCVVFDLDGTLLDENSDVPEEFGEVLREAGEKGVTVAIGTSRPEKELLRLFPMKAENLLLYGLDGNVFIRNGEVQGRDILTREEVEEIHAILSECPDILTAYIGVDGDYMDESIIPHITEWGMDGIIKFNPKPFRPDADIISVFIFCPEGTDAAEKLIKGRLAPLSEHFDMPQAGFGWISVQRKGIGKKQIIHKICDCLDISADEIVVFGDSQNDVPMLRAVRYSYAMKNASDEVRKQALYVTEEDNAHHGAIKAFRTILRRS